MNLQTFFLEGLAQVNRAEGRKIAKINTTQIQALSIIQAGENGHSNNTEKKEKPRHFFYWPFVMCSEQ